MKYKIFARGSQTYYTASKFFPQAFREEVTILYAFVRKVDDFVDQVPADKESFEIWEREWQQVWMGSPTKNKIIKEFIDLAKEKDFDKKWIEGFFASMRFDLEKKTCTTVNDSLWYMYGSAEVIGLMMAKLMDLKPESFETAALLGRSMQYINFIRDIAEDNRLGRVYLPRVPLQKPRTKDEQKTFNAAIQQELALYNKWNSAAKKGFKFIPYKYRIGIMTATDMYAWTGNSIQKRPEIVFERKVKPKTLRILLAGVKNMVKAVWI